MFKRTAQAGFTLVEVIVVISIIALLAGLLSVNFSSARASARDTDRAAKLKQMQVAIELYKAEYGYYPAEGCGSDAGFNHRVEDPSSVDWDGGSTWTGRGPHPASWGNDTSCEEYIVGLVPDYIESLPTDPRDEEEDDKGFIYQVSATGDAYKLSAHDVVEVDQVSDWSDELARCPRPNPGAGACQGSSPPSTVYSIYSAGAEFY